MHTRRVLREAIEALLDGHPDVEPPVEDSRVRPTKPRDLPRIFVSTPSEEPSALDKDAHPFWRVITIQIECMESLRTDESPGAADDLLDAVERALEPFLHEGYSKIGGVHRITFAGLEEIVEGKGEAPTISRVLSFEAIYKNLSPSS